MLRNFSDDSGPTPDSAVAIIYMVNGKVFVAENIVSLPDGAVCARGQYRVWHGPVSDKRYRYLPPYWVEREFKSGQIGEIHYLAPVIVRLAA